MKILSLDDFNNNEAWLVFRIDTQIQHKPVDIYFILDLPNDMILSNEMVEDTITQQNVDNLLKQARTNKNSLPTRIILAYGDPAESFIRQSATELKINFELIPGPCLEELLAPTKKHFAEHFYSPSSVGYLATEDEDNALDRETIKRILPDSYDPCPCASGKKYKFCCKKIFREITEAMAAADDGDLPTALRWIDKAKAIVGETSEVLCREAIVYSYFDYNKGLDILAKCLELNLKHPRAHYIRGITFKENGDYANAVKSYETAIANYPPSDHFHLNEVYNNLGTVFYEMGELAKAKAAWEKALLYMPSDKTVRHNLAEFIYKKR